jgi:hypothetical protein
VDGRRWQHAMPTLASKKSPALQSDMSATSALRQSINVKSSKSQNWSDLKSDIYIRKFAAPIPNLCQLGHCCTDLRVTQFRGAWRPTSFYGQSHCMWLQRMNKWLVHRNGGPHLFSMCGVLALAGVTGGIAAWNGAAAREGVPCLPPCGKKMGRSLVRSPVTVHPTQTH